nr:meiosis specific DNA helicase [Moesziomyces parantarcticus]
MSQEMSFDLLARQYGVDLEENTYGVQPYRNSSQVLTPRYAQSDAATRLASFRWQGCEAPAQGPSVTQLPPHPDDGLLLARHFDFEGAEAAGLLAPSVQQMPPVQTMSTSVALPSFRSSSSGSAVQTYGDRQGQTRQLPSSKADEIFVEPEPGVRIRLVPISYLHPAALYRPLFSFPFFNAVQSMAIPKVLEAGDNVVLSAPTGSGKTVVFELALLRMLTRESESVRAVYLAPTKALCSERTRDWSLRFGSVGCGVTELTGDSLHGLHVARKSRLIITTPEKWDSLTRKWDEQSGILSSVRLVLIDEVHILNEPQRGSRLEVVITRIKYKSRQARFVAVSATVPNLEDVAAWIGSNAAQRDPSSTSLAETAPAEILKFGEAYRPCQLDKHVYGYPKAKDEFAFQSYLNHKLTDLIETHGAGRPCLVFCATRRSTVQAAKAIAEGAKRCGTGMMLGGQSEPEAGNFDDQDLQTFWSSRVSFHHAGLSQNDRRKVEQAFLAGQVHILCCTTTLATGINLPAYCVIIRGTKHYDGQWSQMSELDIIQMMGRAGRPQFDRSGVAVIMCEDTMQNHYRELVSGSRDIESGLAANLVEHVNAEIGLRGRTTEAEIEAWIRQSFMWIRLQKNPTYYLDRDEGIGLDSVSEILQHLSSRTLSALESASLISRSEESGKVASTEYGDIMSRFFLRHKTMLALMAMPEHASTRAVLEAVAEAEEFGDQRLRQAEKGFLAGLRTHAEIRFPPRQIACVADKVSLLIQASLAAINLSQLPKPPTGEASPFSDTKRIFQHAPRIVKAAVDIAICRQDGTACKAALDLARSIAAQAWDGSPAMLRQIDQIGDRSIKALANAGISTWQTLANTSPARVEMILNRNPPFGNKIVAAAKTVPRIGLEMIQRSSMPSKPDLPNAAEAGVSTDLQGRETSRPRIKVVLDIGVSVENRSTCMLKSKTTKLALSLCILTLTADGDFVDFRRMPIYRFTGEKHFTVHVELTDIRTRILTYAACDEIAGTTMQASLLPVDMANGSHRVQLARAEVGQSGGCASDTDSAMHVQSDIGSVSAKGADASRHCPSRDRVQATASLDHVQEEPDSDEDLSWRRDLSDQTVTRRYRIQDRDSDAPGPSPALRVGISSALRSDGPIGPQKRKATEALGADDDDSLNLLGRLDRLFAEVERAPTPHERMTIPRGEEVDPPSLGGVERHDSDDSAVHVSSSHLPESDASSASALAAPAIERPAQRRFLKSLGNPSWLSSSEATNTNIGSKPDSALLDKFSSPPCRHDGTERLQPPTTDTAR